MGSRYIRVTQRDDLCLLCPHHFDIELILRIVPINPGIFGVPLSDSILYANVAISLTNEQGDSFIYGYVPIVVAKCGVFLKEKGIFYFLIDMTDLANF